MGVIHIGAVMAFLTAIQGLFYESYGEYFPKNKRDGYKHWF